MFTYTYGFAFTYPSSHYKARRVLSFKKVVMVGCHPTTDDALLIGVEPIHLETQADMTIENLPHVTIVFIIL